MSSSMKLNKFSLRLNDFIQAATTSPEMVITQFNLPEVSGELLFGEAGNFPFNVSYNIYKKDESADDDVYILQFVTQRYTRAISLVELDREFSSYFEFMLTIFSIISNDEEFNFTCSDYGAPFIYSDNYAMNGKRRTVYVKNFEITL